MWQSRAAYLMVNTIYTHIERAERGREGGRGKDRRQLGARQILESHTLTAVFLNVHLSMKSVTESNYEAITLKSQPPLCGVTCRGASLQHTTLAGTVPVTLGPVGV